VRIGRSQQKEADQRLQESSATIVYETSVRFYIKNTSFSQLLDY